MNKEIYNELIAFHPGYYVAEVIEDMEITQEEFAKRLDLTPKHLSELVNGKAKITPDIAKKLSFMLNTSIEMWLNLQKAYEVKIAEIDAAKDMNSQIDIIKLLDYNFFVKNNFISYIKESHKRVTQLCSFFQVSSLNVLRRPDLSANFRSSSSVQTDKNVICANAWLETAIQIGKGKEVKRYKAEKLQSFLPQIRELTLKQPDIFIPELDKIFVECGIALVLLPKMKNAKINGVVKWLTSSKALVAMNDRQSYTDTFWFSLFHEIKHVFQHKTKQVMISCTDRDLCELNKQYEDEADDFSQNYLIPPKEYEMFVSTSSLSKASVRQFANRIGIHPGIVVGRLQNDGILEHSMMNDLRDKISILVKA